MNVATKAMAVDFVCRTGCCTPTKIGGQAHMPPDLLFWGQGRTSDWGGRPSELVIGSGDDTPGCALGRALPRRL